MKTNQFILFASGLALFTSLNSCKPKNERVIETTDPETNIITGEERIVITDAEREKEITTFKHDAELRIDKNNERIEELRAKIATADDRMKAEYKTRISELEERNKKQRDRLSEYKDDNNEGWEKFKREFNHDMDELGDALKSFGENNKK